MNFPTKHLLLISLLVLLFSTTLFGQTKKLPEPHLIKGDIEVMDSLIVRGSLDKAIKLGLELNDTQPKNLRVMEGLIFSYTVLGLTDEVRHWLRSKEEVDNSDYRSHFYTYMEWVDGDYEKAKEELKKLISQASSENPEAWYKVVPLSLHLGDYDRVISATENFMKLKPEKKNLLALYAFALIQKGEKTKAEKVLAEHKQEMQFNLQKEKDYYNSHLNLAKIAAVEGNSEAAIFHLDKYMDGYIPEFIHYFLIDEPAHTFWDNIREDETYQEFFKAKKQRLENMKSSLKS